MKSSRAVKKKCRVSDPLLELVGAVPFERRLEDLVVDQWRGRKFDGQTLAVERHLPLAGATFDPGSERVSALILDVR